MQGYQYSVIKMTPQAMRNLHKSDAYKPKRAISEFSSHQHYVFSEEDHKFSFCGVF